MGNFTRICHEVAAIIRASAAEDWYIDIMTANLVNPAIRNKFQVFVLPNLYGDIITDEAAEIRAASVRQAAPISATITRCLKLFMAPRRVW